MRAVVTKHFGQQLIFSHFPVEVEQGSIVRLAGPSGSGKTTLMRILSGLESNEEPGNNDFLSHRFAWVFQEDRLAETMSGYKNLYYSVGPLSKKSAEEYFSMLGLDDISKPVSQYSGGMKRRLALLRAMLCPGEIIMLDEPFAGLDDRARESACEFIMSMRKGRTIIFSGHDADGGIPADSTIAIQAC